MLTLKAAFPLVGCQHTIVLTTIAPNRSAALPCRSPRRNPIPGAGAITFGYLVGRLDALQQHKRRSAGIPC
jgi:hypothetical protein